MRFCLILLAVWRMVFFVPLPQEVAKRRPIVASGGSGNIAPDTTTTSSATVGTSFSGGFAVSVSAANEFLVVTFMSSHVPSAACQFNGTNMSAPPALTNPVNDSANASHISTYVVFNPATGSHNVDCFTATTSTLSATADLYTGVNATTQMRNCATAVDNTSGTQTTASVVASNAVSTDYVYAAMVGLNSNLTLTPNQNVRGNVKNPASDSWSYSSQYFAATGSTTMSWGMSYPSGTVFWAAVACPMISS